MNARHGSNSLRFTLGLARAGVAAVCFLSSVNFAWAESAPRDGGGTFNAGSPAVPGSGAFQSASLAGENRYVRRPDPTEAPTASEQAKFYERANENVALQSLYIDNRLAALDRTLDDLAQDPTKVGDDRIKRETSGYCEDNGSTTVDCIKQFKAIKTGELRELRQALIAHDDAIATLRSELVDAKERGKARRNRRVAIAGASGKSRVIPAVPTFLDLSNDYAAGSRVNDGSPLKTREDAIRWATRVLQPPRQEDFVKTHEVLRDPDDSRGNTMQVIDRDAQGRPIPDPAEYQKALQTYQRLHQITRWKKSDGATDIAATDENGRREALVDRVLNMHRALNTNGRPPQTLSQAVDRTPNPAPQAPLTLDTCGALSSGARQDYCLARAVLVQTYNGERTADGTARVTGQGAQRTPGAAPSPAADLTSVREDHRLKPDKVNGVDTDGVYMDRGEIDKMIDAQSPAP